MSRTDTWNEPVRFRLDGDLAGISELNGVADEINQDLGQAAAVTVARR